MILELVLVEPRRHPDLERVVTNVAEMIPNAPLLTIVCSKSNESMCLAALNSASHVREKRCLVVLPDNLQVCGYNQILVSTSFWKMLKGDKVLIFQCDSGMLKNELLDYMRYDYVGAPWDVDRGLGGSPRFVGNGGFSLRTRAAMLDAAEEPATFPGPEDVYFSRYADPEKYDVAPVEVASKFSTECGTDGTMAWHAVLPASAATFDERGDTVPEIRVIRPDERPPMFREWLELGTNARGLRWSKAAWLVGLGTSRYGETFDLVFSIGGVEHSCSFRWNGKCYESCEAFEFRSKKSSAKCIFPKR